MNTPVETKTCPRCAETIKAAAKVCPFCQSGLSFWGLWQREVGVVVSVLTLLAVFGLLMELLFPEWLRTDGGLDFTGHRDELPVQRIALDGPNLRSEFWASGFVTNCGAYPWRVRELEFRFLNPDGSLLDVRHPRIDRPFVVQPGGEHAFRVPVGRLPQPMVRADLKARVQEASDGTQSPKPEWSSP